MIILGNKLVEKLFTSNNMSQENKIGEEFSGQVIADLSHGPITHLGLFESGNNYTFLVRIENGLGKQCMGIYKPFCGEAPLSDFPWGTLYKREVASYLVSTALGWEFIPPTVVRDGPYGIGSLQLYIEHNPEENYFTLKGTHNMEFQQICLFDFVTNNADRKAGHCLKGLNGRIWGIDHGLTFNVLEKLRTVIWEFSGEPISDKLKKDLKNLYGQVTTDSTLLRLLNDLISMEEVYSFVERLEQINRKATFPKLDLTGRRSWPYPLL